jgi:glutamate N-acetyltransferase/amino-acid N-acetyltransferase
MTAPLPSGAPAPLTRPAAAAVTFLPGGDWTSVPGVRVGIAGADIKGNKKLRDDVIILDAPGTAAAVITTSTAAAAPCRWTRARVPGPVRAVLVNAGNANASTGEQGARDTAASAERVAALLGCTPAEVLVCSTGVIGVPMPMGRLLLGIEAAAGAFGTDGARAARAILTTDLTPKSHAVQDGEVIVGGMAKGSGMIDPNMATMLGFLVTNAAVEAAHLQALLAAVTAETFNAVSVDGCMSTNDTVILQATGQGPVAAPGTPAWEALRRAVTAVAGALAEDIARDGEGATTLLEVVVMGLDSDEAARAAAKSVVRSHLFKAAVLGRDPNWGRIVGALGAAGVPHLDRLDLDLGDVPVLRDGQPVPWDEAAASAAMEPPVARVTARLPGVGYGRALGCDLTAAYVSINADYRS